jgi:4-hydroxymandelate oxidase
VARDAEQPDAPKPAGFQQPPADDPNLINLADFETAALNRMSPDALAYFVGGSMDERTVRENRAAFSRYRIRPLTMRDVSTIDMSCTVLGRRWPSPFFISPSSQHGLGHPDGELATARAAAARGVTYTLSVSSSQDLADVAAVAGPRWFQVYLPTDQGARRALIERAAANGYEALVMTVDLPRLGWRERMLRSGYQFPVGLPNFTAAYKDAENPTAEPSFLSSMSWDHLDWLASFGLPVIVKGVLDPDDAIAFVDHGAAAIQVSNHGGRQLDAAIASLDALPAIVEAVDGRVPVLFDGGVRRGTDSLMALALGAKAIGIGQPILWGLVVNGEAGVRRILDIVIAELDHVMALAGTPTLDDISSRLVLRPA